MDAVQSLMQEPTFRDLLHSFEKMNNDREQAAAKANPAKHKLSRLFDPRVSASYRFWPAGKNGKGQKVLFCWSSHRNVAGYFLGWRQTHMKNGTVKRDRWLARKVKRRCAEIAKRRAGIKDINCEEQT